MSVIALAAFIAEGSPQALENAPPAAARVEAAAAPGIESPSGALTR